MISLIAAVGKNNELGKGNNLLWPLPTDQRYFREITTGHTVIMGRKTFESIGRLLPNRRNIVITRHADYKADGIEIAHSLNEAIELGKNNPDINEEIFIIGGAEIYKQGIALADKLYITKIDAEDKDADAFFPEINMKQWQEISREEHEPDDINLYKYIFLVYTKLPATAAASTASTA
jgi:dihydrofolate reductase